ncbi:MAG: hypothetical protein GY759_06900 [Chloroflexi bacterium]|nr:hypothetical protein [Chloroflexota bacterium]
MILVIGLDGADWDVLDPWLESGKLPVLANLRARAVWGGLRSTIRPESSIAWSTFATGVGPGRHGIFGFSAQRPDSYTHTLNTATALRSPTFWQQAATAGKHVAVFNVPMTYPPQPLSGGALVAGMLTPGLRSTFTDPPDLQKQLLTAIPDYVINVERTGLSLRKFIQGTTRAIQIRGRAARWLLKQRDWDAAIITFTATDRLQHFALHMLAPGHPHYDTESASELLPDLLAAYQALDRAIGTLLDTAGADATILVLSDHGFAPCARFFYANVWLEQHGWLHRRPVEPASTGLWHYLRAHPELRRLKNALPFIRDLKRSLQVGEDLATVDWTRTRAVYSPTGGVRLNVRGRETQGLVDPNDVDELLDELSHSLLEYQDPGTGTQPLLAVYRRETLYDGPYVDLAPDLILEPRRNDTNVAHNTALMSGFTKVISTDSGDITGNHTLDGILMAAGPDIRPGAIENARLIDLAPTLLHALQLPVPRDLDGQVLPLWAPTRPVEWSDDGVPPADWSERGQEYNAEDQQVVEDRLRALGYL